MSGKAFTLLEVIIGTFIFVSMVVIFTGIWPTITHATTQQRRHMIASTLASNVIEQYIALANNSSSLTPTNGHFQVTCTFGDIKSQEDYRYYTTLTPVGTHTTEVNVTVRWAEQGRQKTLSDAVVLYLP